jgi:predicted MPP superfamily phosphohydrolase
MRKTVGKEKRGPRGRGRNYAMWRHVMELALGVAYRGDWPALVWGRLPGTCRITVVRHTLRIPESVSALQLTIGFVSDLHIGPGTPKALLVNAFRALASENPDVLVFGGDYVFLDAKEPRLRLLRSLIDSVGAGLKVAVMGNHDLWTDDAKIESALVSAGVRMITNDAVFLPPPHEGIALLGIDEPYTGEPDPRAALDRAGGAGFRIAVCHSPEGAFGLLGKVELFLAGHTHGGQVALPCGFPILLPPGRGCRKWPAGRYYCKGTEVIVSRGVGGTELPVRTFSPPEVIVIRLVPLAESSKRGVGQVNG